MLFHLGMAMRNETMKAHQPVLRHWSIAQSALRLGRKTWTWPLPLYLNGPDGDGLSGRASTTPATGLRDEFGGSRTSNAVACGSGASSNGASHSAAKTVPSRASRLLIERGPPGRKGWWSRCLVTAVTPE